MKKSFDVHPAIRLVREGRGLTMLVPECDLVAVGTGASLHVRGEDGRPVCHVRGEVGDVLEGCDPRSVVVARRVVCGNCRDRIGYVPSPTPAEEVEDGHALGITRTQLDAERRRARRAA